MISRCDVLVVASQAPWPVDLGWRVRTANVIDQLARHLRVDVVGPALPAHATAPQGITYHSLPAAVKDRRLHGLLRAGPHMGHAALGPIGRQVVLDLVGALDPGVVFFTDTALAAVVPLDRPTVVDVVNVELHRYRSFALHDHLAERATLAVEALKAAVWEPRAVRQATVAVALTPRDAAWLRRRGARVVVVPHGRAPLAQPYRPSPPDGPVTFVASADYEPNRDGGLWLLQQVWPHVRRQAPHARLAIVGRRACAVFGWADGRDGVDVHGDVASVSAHYDNAGVVVAPVRYGAGSQLKVVEALAAGRVVVATPYSARSIPSSVRATCMVARAPAAFARAVAALLHDADGRHERERLLAAGDAGVPTWEAACAPLVAAVVRLSEGGWR